MTQTCNPLPFRLLYSQFHSTAFPLRIRQCNPMTVKTPPNGTAWLNEVPSKAFRLRAASIRNCAKAASPTSRLSQFGGKQMYDAHKRRFPQWQNRPSHKKVHTAVEVEAGKTYSWCACGISANQPFCDGSHRGGEFTPIRFEATETKTAYFADASTRQTSPIAMERTSSSEDRSSAVAENSFYSALIFNER